MPVDKFGRMRDTKTKDTGVSLTYINNNYIRSDGTTPASGSINMNDNTLYNVPDPVNPQDVATKEYADHVRGGEAAIVKTRYGNYGAIGNIDMQGYTLMNVLDPADAQDVATKQYVDDVAKTLTLEEALIKENGGYNIANAYINMNFNNIKNIGEPGHISDAATKGYVDDSINKVVDNVGGGGPFLKENGNYKATHTINMAYNKLLNLHKPIEPYDAATKDYVDYVKTILNERLNTIDERPHIIAVSANYCGDVFKGDYQFAFGGSACKESGFLIPHPGRIKK